METKLRARLAEALRVGSLAYVRNLVAAEQAIQRGQFNIAKILRAAAHAQRTLALNAGRLLGEETSPPMLLQAILEETTGATVPASGQEDPAVEELLARAGVVRERVAEMMRRSLHSLRHNPDVLESDVPQSLWGCYACGNIMAGARPAACDICGALPCELETFGPYYSRSPEHLGQLTPAAMVTILEATPTQVAKMILGVDDSILTHKPSPDEWCAKELVGHLIETDRLYQGRVRTILAGSGVVEFSDPKLPWEAHHGKGYEEMPTGELVQRLEASHAASLAIMADLTPPEWCRLGIMNGAVRSLVDLGTWLANHDRGHLPQIRRLCGA
jgi:rubrerythrin